MTRERYGIVMAAEVMKQLITIGLLVVAAVASLLLVKADASGGKWLGLGAIASGSACVLLCLLFLADIAARSLGATSKAVGFRRKLFVLAWSLFLLSVVMAACFALVRAGAV